MVSDRRPVVTVAAAPKSWLVLVRIVHGEMDKSHGVGTCRCGITFGFEYALTVHLQREHERETWATAFKGPDVEAASRVFARERKRDRIAILMPVHETLEHN